VISSRCRLIDDGCGVRADAGSLPGDIDGIGEPVYWRVCIILLHLIKPFNMSAQFITLTLVTTNDELVASDGNVYIATDMITHIVNQPGNQTSVYLNDKTTVAVTQTAAEIIALIGT
jgi:hypothetical protein